MTYEEAIDFAEKLKNNYTIDFNDIEPFCELAIDALQKQIPMKRNKTITYIQHCPKCKCVLSSSFKYCDECGQRINLEGVK